jgi:ADP-ribose pyrophosphatase YjhB (NUDIX family)
MKNEDKDLYFVAVKVFLKNRGKFLILHDSFGDWDIPGGRIKINEFSALLDKVAERKIREELGAKLRFVLKAPVVFMRHERREAVKGNPKVRIFAVGYEAKYVSGNIELSHRHTEYKWVFIASFRPEKFFRGGWLKGVKEYLALKRCSK